MRTSTEKQLSIFMKTTPVLLLVAIALLIAVYVRQTQIEADNRTDTYWRDLYQNKNSQYEQMKTEVFGLNDRLNDLEVTLRLEIERRCDNGLDGLEKRTASGR